jgi:hypothetical protein
MNSYELAVLKRYPFPLTGLLSLLEVNFSCTHLLNLMVGSITSTRVLLQGENFKGNANVILGCPWGRQAIDTVICDKEM